MNLSLLSNLAKPSAITKFFGDLGLPSPEASETKEAIMVRVVRISNCKSQKDVAVLAINLTEGEISGEDLTKVLKAACPKDEVAERHGPHYLSSARTGKLAGVNFIPAKKGRVTVVQVSTTDLEARIKELEAELAKKADLEARVQELEVKLAQVKEAKSLKDVKALFGSVAE